MSYSTSSVRGSENVGGLVGYTTQGQGRRGPLGSATASFWDVETSGQTTSDGGTGKTTTEMQTSSTFLNVGWDFADETANGPNDIWKISEGLDYPRLWWEKYGGGTGEPNDPYRIYTAEHLNAIGAEPNDWDKHFKLMADIDLAGYEYDMAVIAPDTDDGRSGFQGIPFSGAFDGNEHVIVHLSVEGWGCLGLFGKVASGAEIRDIGVTDVNITGSDDLVGGLVAFNLGSVTHCYATGDVYGKDLVGGLAGQNGKWLIRPDHGNIRDCYSIGLVSGESNFGGIVGRMVVGQIAYSFWDRQTSEVIHKCGNYEDDPPYCDDAWGRTTTELQSANTFLEAGWDFADETANGTEDIWWILEGQDYPRLWWEAAGQ